MKKFYFLTILTISGYLLNAQDFYISFQSAVTNTQIDSILVTNQKTSQKVKLLENEQLLLTKSTTGIQTLQSGFEVRYLYPNPCYGDAGFFFSTDKSGEVVLGIYNASGQLLNRERQDLAPGLHRFQVKFPFAGIYFISVLKNGGPLSFKAVCLGNTLQMSRITYEGSGEYNYSEAAVPLKSTVAGKTMIYSAGDILHYSSFSGKNNTIITDSPTANKVYAVEFYACMDQDNQNYPVVKIGNQWWMAENLKTTKYKDGSQIASITDNTIWAGLTTSAYCWHDNNSGNKAIYGALYNWYAVNTAKLCPAGWHVPTDAEWTALENYLVANGYNYDGTTSGNKIAKSLAAPTNWTSSSGSGTVGNTDYPAYQNLTGFSALPGNARREDGSFGSVGNSGNWWGSTGGGGNSFAWYRNLSYNSGNIIRAISQSTGGFSVRCVMDILPTVTTNPITNVTQTTATGGGNVTSDGGAVVTERGVCWNTSQNPTTANSKTTDGVGTGSFTSNLTGLKSNTKFYVRAYATNSAGTAYGEQMLLFPLPANLPVVSTADITAIGETIATGGGNVISDGGDNVSARGVCWSTTSTPTTANSKTTNGTGTGTYISNLTGLVAGTTYYARAYATNSTGTAYGEQKQFRARNQTGTFQDTRDNTVYDWVKIGTQTWMAENLAYLPSVNPPSEGSETSLFYYVYGYDGANVSTARATSNYSIYGALYNWWTASTACPAGWHLPSDVEWTTLENYMIANGYNYDGTTTGNKIAKSLAATTNWISYQEQGTPGNILTTNNTSGFSALPGGYRNSIGAFGSVGFIGNWWSSTVNINSEAWSRNLYNSYADVLRGDYYKSSGFSVRCIRGEVLSYVTTNSITAITQITATSGGFVISDGGATVTARGVCWSTSQNPTTANSRTTNGTGTGSFTSSLTGLTANTLYYTRAYATNAVGTAYGGQFSFTTLPTVTTNPITGITQTTATSGGTVDVGGGAAITARGVCWSTSQNPTTANSKTTDGTGAGSFTSNLTGLTAGTLYYVRAYATNSAGTAYGEQKQFHAKNQTGLFQDSRDQTFYYWVKIGTQTWMSSNLSYLPGVSPSSSGSGTSPYYYVYNYQGTDVLMARNLIDNKGVLYNWPAALSACPPGWHLPTDAEWTTLENYMIANVYNYDGTTTGNKIAKSLAVTSGWVTSTNTGAIGNILTDNNISGFSALPGGYRYISGVFGSVGSAGLWWSSSEANVSNAWGRVLNFDSASANRNFLVKTEGLSVRCVKD